MKILVISEYIGKTAPGRVFETLLSELTSYSELTILTCNYNVTDNSSLSECEIIKLRTPLFHNQRLTTYINKFSTRIFHESLTDYILRRSIRDINAQDYDIILALCSAGSIAPLGIADKIKANSTTKIVAYLVDAYPTPSWWGKSKEFNGVEKYIKRFTKNVDTFISSNPLMLDYQKKFLNKKVTNFGVLYPVVGKNQIKLDDRPQNSPPIFLYTGLLYGLRSPKHILEAFQLLLKEYPQARMKFIGTGDQFLSSCNKEIINNIDIIEFSNNLIPFYQEATALLDIDADVEEDIFLSSKVTNYLLTNRPIICETGIHTPARILFSNFSSILLCGHNSLHIYKAMKKTIEARFDYDDRELLLDQINVKVGAKQIINCI